MDFLKSLPAQYCRICFKDKGQSLVPVNEELKENFYSLTNIHLIKSDIYSNLICTQCTIKINDSKKFRDDLIENELRLMNEISSNPHFTIIDPQKITTQQSDVKHEDKSFDLDESFSTDEPLDFVSEMLMGDDESSSEFEEQEASTSRPKRKYNKKPKLEDKNLQTTEDGKAICPHCSKAVFKFYLPQHIERMHLKVKNFNCDQCGKSFYHHSSIESHMTIHIQNKLLLPAKYEFICEVCAVRFKKRYQLQEHISTKHDGLRFKCTYEGCQLEYLSTKALKNHVESIHESRLETCEFCGKILRSGQQLYQHKRRKHMEYKFTCSNCPKKFSSASELSVHFKVHINQKDHICPICNSRYHAKKYLNRHIQVAHRKSKFFCKIPGCKSVLCNKDNFRAHVRTVHKSLPPQQLEDLLAAITTMKPDYLEDPEMIS